MNKRYGTVLGGEEIEFTGTGFTTSDNGFLSDFEPTASVHIDGIACEITSQTDRKSVV